MEETKRVPRRPHSEELKARVLAECMHCHYINFEASMLSY
jgi:hypothetical protein